MEGKMIICVTGSLGLIGGELSQQLIAAGHDVIGNDDLSHECYAQSEIAFTQFFPCRVSQLDMFHMARPDLIIHCASPVGHARLTPEAQVAWQIVSDTQAVLDLANRTGARVIIFSSSEVLTYRGETDIRAQYSIGKLAAEAMALGHPTVDCRVVRPYNVTGRRQRTDGGFVMARFRDAMLVGEPLTVFGTGEQRRCFLHVSDFARFIVLLAERWPERRLWSVFNPGNGITINRLAWMFYRNYEEVNARSYVDRELNPCDVLNNPTWRDTPERSLCTEDFMACRELGWTPYYDLGYIVREHLGQLETIKQLHDAYGSKAVSARPND